jgi:subtilisin family serine protease
MSIATALAAFLIAGCAGPGPLGAPAEAPPIPMPLQGHVAVRGAADRGLQNAADEQGMWNLAQIGFRTSPDGAPIVVAVLDTGADTTHPELAGRTYPVLDVVGQDVFHGTSDVDFTARDGNGHGTHVAGVVLAVAGSAPVRVLPVKVIPHSGVGDDRLLAAGIEKALAWRDADDPSIRVRVLNLSVSSPEVSDRLVKVIRKATDAGVLVVGASGNEGKAVEFPATMDEVLTVGATTSGGGWASYSCYGDAVDLAAPGGSEMMPVFSTWPSYLTASDLEAGKRRPHLTAGLVGTSMAAPHVSGAAGVIWGLRPSLSAGQVRARLLAMADDLGTPGPDARYGFGRLQLSRALEVDGHDAR